MAIFVVAAGPPTIAHLAHGLVDMIVQPRSAWWVNFSLGVAGSLDLAMVFKQALDLTVALKKTRWYARGVQHVQRASVQHLREGLVGTDKADLDVGGQITPEFFNAAGLLFTTLQVGLRIHRHPVVVAQNTANPRRGGHLVFGAGDALADQLLQAVHTQAGLHSQKHGRAGQQRQGYKVFTGVKILRFIQPWVDG